MHLTKVFLSLLFFLLVSTLVNSQSNIPAPIKSNSIVEVNLKNAFKYISQDTYNNSKWARKLMNQVLQTSYANSFGSLDDSVVQIKNFGIDLNKTVYLHRVVTDSCIYKVSLIPLTNAQQLKELVITGSGSVAGMDYALGKIYKTGKKALIYIQPDYAITITGDYDDSFFRDSVNSARYNVHYPYDSYTYATESAAVDKAEAPYVDTAYSVDDVIGVQSADSAYEPDESVTQSIDDEADKSESDYDRYYNGVDSVTYVWLQAYLEQLLKSDFSTSQQLAKLKNYKSPAAGTIMSYYFLDDLLLPLFHYFGYLPYLYGKKTKFSTRFSDDWTVYDLKIEGRNLVLDSRYFTSSQNLAFLKKINKQKPDKKMLRYINENTDLGVMSVAMNTENYLLGMPDILANIYNGNSKKESLANVLADLTKTIFDERAIAKIFPGKALIIANGVKEIEHRSVSYTTDTVDFEQKADTIYTKKKMPTFIGMVATHREDMVERWLRLAVQKGALTNKDGIYSIQKKEFDKLYSLFAWEGHFYLKKGVLFFASELKDIQEIKNNTYKGGRLSTVNKRKLNNNIYGWWNVARIPDFIEKPKHEEYENKDRLLKSGLKKLKNISVISTKVDNEKFGATYVLEPADDYNGTALEALWQIFDNI